jgi:hypothetical protein
MRALKRVIAFVGSAAAAIGLAASAMTAFAFQPVDLDDRASELKSGITNIIADEVYAEPGETVSYRVMIQNNKGYGPSGIALNYDAALTPVLEANGVKPALKWGDGSYGLTKSYSINKEKHLLGIGTTGTDNCEKDGVIYTAQFVVPADAKENTVYPMTLTIDKFLDAATDPVANNPVNGWIRVRKPVEETTVSTTKATTTTTTLTTVTTVSTSKSSVSTEPTTSKSVTNPTTVSSTVTKIETDVSTVSNTSKTDRQDPNKSEPTTASRQGGVTATTKKATTSSSTTTATKTGDAGVGIAVTALLLSGTVAAVCKRKKEH